MEVDLTSVSKRFSDHLENDHLEKEKNNRILFSGKFGIGKTYFLNKFFDDNSDKYETFHITPVNYSVSNNNDILEYIKHDILFKLLEKDIDYDEIKISKAILIPYFLQNNINKLSQLSPFFIAQISEVGGSLSIIAPKIVRLISKFRKEFREINLTSERKIINHLKSFTGKKGIYEEDFITELIRNLVNQLKTNRKIVLIIDDLDRVDPDHIFRILNVFSTHIDFVPVPGRDFQNKFDFSQIILVCDLNNIKEIFAHKYGNTVDFLGYMNKFYATDVFHFDIIKDIIKNITHVNNSIIKCGIFGERRGEVVDRYKDGLELTLFVVKSLIESGMITIRMIQKILRVKDVKKFNFNRYRYRFSLSISESTQNLISYLHNIFHHFDHLLYVCSNSRESKNFGADYDEFLGMKKRFIEDLLGIILFARHYENSSNGSYSIDDIILTYKYAKIDANATIHDLGKVFEIKVEIIKITSNDIDINIRDLDFFVFLRKAIEELIKLKMV
ncbi:P-loop NTPase fold protein [Pleomorphovibrio marinus]|uniref:P-loop NTPase fold protein n=1 Tax=Pleomorphovibrio marinus TaxID=2164132 RepID=UPI000E0C31E2|nr:P-loop NTPase fold protein [Pleomorphovibrio marinus]